MLIHLEKLGKSFGEKIVLHDVTASVEREDRIGIVGQNGAGKTTLLKILTGEYMDYEGEFSVTHGVTLGYLEQNAKLDPTLDIYGEMRSCFAHVLDAMAQMQILERRMAASSEDASLLEQHYSVDRRHAKLLARDQIAKLNGDITQQQQQDAGVVEYVWSTSGDSRVRPSHAALNHKRFRWDDPPVVDEKTGRRCHPGKDYQCRCCALPVFNIKTVDLPVTKGGDGRG